MYSGELLRGSFRSLLPTDITDVTSPHFGMSHWAGCCVCCCCCCCCCWARRTLPEVLCFILVTVSIWPQWAMGVTVLLGGGAAD
jgi:hypothetical protein